jgi:hypothetical protein
MRLDLLIALASTEVLLISAFLLTPTARLLPEDIVFEVFKGHLLRSDPGTIPWPTFPERDVKSGIKNVLDSKMGLVLLCWGTILNVLATTIGALRPSWSVPPPASILLLSLAAAGVLFCRMSWYRKRERCCLVHCFLVWLEELAVVGPQAKSDGFGRVVVATARRSGFSLLEDLREADDEAVARKIKELAHKCGYRWRRDDFREWDP